MYPQGLVVITAAAENITETTVPDVTGKTVVTVMEATIAEAAGETVAPVTVVTVPNMMGETVENVTVVTVPDTPGKMVAPVTEATVPGMTMTIVLGHKKISTSGLPSVKSFSSSTMKISRESTLFFKSTAKQLTLEGNKLVRSTSINLTFRPEKEQQSSGLVIGLSIFFGMLLIIVIIICRCIWKKSRVSVNFFIFIILIFLLLYYSYFLISSVISQICSNRLMWFHPLLDLPVRVCQWMTSLILLGYTYFPDTLIILQSWPMPASSGVMLVPGLQCYPFLRYFSVTRGFCTSKGQSI
ncbi:putative protein arginine N-methyltransferase 9 [Platysternon megacephalum]|uniref:Uncharacterized protein n=1 Tax=Platysternon megacephalum TaxID=55544 RepID=A0A4D9EZW1_9SAUR|nr:putative protein arginine N-methyltransferase 9 [Platysternon megacephalum]